MDKKFPEPEDINEILKRPALKIHEVQRVSGKSRSTINRLCDQDIIKRKKPTSNAHWMYCTESVKKYIQFDQANSGNV